MTFDENKVNTVYLMNHSSANTQSSMQPDHSRSPTGMDQMALKRRYLTQPAYYERSLPPVSSRSMPLASSRSVSPNTSSSAMAMNYLGGKPTSSISPYSHGMGNPSIPVPNDSKRPAPSSIDMAKRFRGTNVQGTQVNGSRVAMNYPAKQSPMQHSGMSQSMQMNMSGMQSMQSVQGMQNMQNMQGMQNVQGMQNMQNVQGTQSMQNVQNMQMKQFASQPLRQPSLPSTIPNYSMNGRAPLQAHDAKVDVGFACVSHQ